MTTTQTFMQTLVVQTCCYERCGVSFGMTQGFDAARREDHAWWYCPNGHKQHYSAKNETEQLRERLRTAQRSESFYRAVASSAREAAATARRSAAAQKGHRTRVLNMIAAGICPAPGCRRHFTNVQRHMASQHPDFHTHEDTP